VLSGERSSVPVPIDGSPLVGRTSDKGRTLTVVSPSGETVVEAALGEAASPAYAVFETAAGRFRIPHSGGSHLTGKEWTSVFDESRNPVAVIRTGEIILPGDESSSGSSRPWGAASSANDLWRAKKRRRGFKADLSQAMLAREDKDVVPGIASVLTVSAWQRGDQLASAAGWLSP
jgi:hypothetical protein